MEGFDVMLSSAFYPLWQKEERIKSIYFVISTLWYHVTFSIWANYMTHIIASPSVSSLTDSFTADLLTKSSPFQSLNHKQCFQIKGLVLKAIQPSRFDDHFWLPITEALENLSY